MNTKPTLVIDGQKWCYKCDNVLPVDKFGKNRLTITGFQWKCIPCTKADRKILYQKHRSKWLEESKTRHKELRYEVLYKYSKGTMKCACCEEAQYEFLSLDHINGGGGKHRKEVKSIWYFLKRENFPLGYQVLCHNCNQAKGAYGTCPHSR